MPKNIFLTATQRGSGKSTVALGLIALLERSIGDVGYFKPIGHRNGDGVDPDVALMRDTFRLGGSMEDIQPFTMEDVADSLAHDSHDQLLGDIIGAHARIATNSDVVLCEGTDYQGAMAAFESNINAEISQNLNAPILLVASAVHAEDGGDREFSELIDDICMVKESFDDRGCDFFGVIINKCEPAGLKDFHRHASAVLGEHGVELLGSIPRSDMLSRVRLDEVSAQIGAEVLMGAERLNTMAQSVVVGAMGLENALARIKKGALVITAGDRHDLLLGTAASYISPSAPTPAGVVLTCGHRPAPHILSLVADMTGSQMPVMRTDSTTYQTALAVDAVKPRLEADQRMRIEVAKGLVARHVDDGQVLASVAFDDGLNRVTPGQFLHQIMERAGADKKHIVLPEGEDERILKAAAILLEREVVDLTLLSYDEAKVRRHLAQLTPRSDEVRVIDPRTSELRDGFAERYMELRAHKNPTLELASDLMSNVSYFGTMMVQEGLADGMVSGAAHTTAHTLRPAFEFVKVRKGMRISSSVFFMCLPDNVLVYGDCAVNPNPTTEELADIAMASADTAAVFGIDPMVAMLSYSTGESGSGSDVDKVRGATDIVKAARPNLAVEGPIQYDAAVDPDVGRAKLPGSRVAGAATVFIFPDLNSGNNTYKAVQRSAHAIAVGPVMQGLNKPVNDLSRGCTVRDIVNTVAITAVQAQRS